MKIRLYSNDGECDDRTYSGPDEHHAAVIYEIGLGGANSRDYRFYLCRDCLHKLRQETKTSQHENSYSCSPENSVTKA